MDDKIWIKEDNAGSVRYDISPDLIALVESYIPTWAKWPAAYTSRDGKTIVVSWDDHLSEEGIISHVFDISEDPIVVLPIPMWVLGVNPRNTTLCLRSEVVDYFEPLLKWYEANKADTSDSQTEQGSEPDSASA
jgi:hypothetical protein